MDREQFLRDVQEADMVLIGLGEEFQDSRLFRTQADYVAQKEQLAEKEREWLLPFYQEYLRKKYGSQAQVALLKLKELVADKNYFVVSTATNDCIAGAEWKKDFCVMPCGNLYQKQCAHKCEGSIMPVSEAERAALEDWFAGKESAKEAPEQIFGTCAVCGGGMVPNLVYVPDYDEGGYLAKWELYTKWLQGSLNKRLLVLELGVGMQFPSVIRWPFEKIVFFNQKAKFYRVNEKLYQMTEDLKEKGVSIAENTIDWLQGL